MTDELALEVVLDIVDEEVHDRFRDAVLDVFAYDQEVRPDQFLCKDTNILKIK